MRDESLCVTFMIDSTSKTLAIGMYQKIDVSTMVMNIDITKNESTHFTHDELVCGGKNNNFRGSSAFDRNI